MNDFEDNKFDIVLVKDLSRIGRKNGSVLVLLDKFKERNKDIILIEEQAGGYSILNDNDDIIGIKTWYNEMYVKDISRKIRANMHSKQRNGSLVMGNKFGYIKDKKNRTSLIIDEEVRPIIRKIFDLYNSGWGYKKICDILNEKKVPTPSQYWMFKKYEKNEIDRRKVTQFWQSYMISRIIKDDIYIGRLRTRKKTTEGIKGKIVNTAKEENYMFDNHHEAIISLEEFNYAQEINKKRKQTYYKGGKKYRYLFSGIIYCGECNKVMTGLNMKRSLSFMPGYNCTEYVRYGNKKCSNHVIAERELLIHIKILLTKILDEYRKNIQEASEIKQNNSINDRIEKLESKLYNFKKELRLIINEKVKEVNGELDNNIRKIKEKSYSDLINEKAKRIEYISICIKDAKNEKYDNNNNVDTILKKELNDITNRKLLCQLVDSIYVYKDNKIVVNLKINIDKLTQ